MALASGLGVQLPKRALVTGGNGFVGRRIVNMLLDQGEAPNNQNVNPRGEASARLPSLLVSIWDL